MDTKPLKKDWALTQVAFDKLLNALKGDSQSAAERYEIVRAKLMRFFRVQGSSMPEDHADEVFNRVARRLSEGEDLDFAESNSYFLQTARFLLKEYFREARRSIIPLEDLAPELEPNEDPIETSRRLQERIERELGLQALEDCRKELKRSEMEILDEYDIGSGREKIERRNALAAKLNKSKSTLIVEVSRIRQRLKDCAIRKLDRLEVVV